MAFNPYGNVYDVGMYGYGNKPPLYPLPYPPMYYPPYWGQGGGWYGYHGHHHGHHHGHFGQYHDKHDYHQGWNKREDELAQVSRRKGSVKKKALGGRKK
ncbi:hypothetical protein [Paenibacillus silviterrae]|uniref:hypothetical protein n=1 Tax=Paenibacillus silviterrae TaxID=3242194 RepID=UPI002543B858|nr:hypothetical protein [Paenibacillus chinjuensis]